MCTGTMGSDGVPISLGLEPPGVSMSVASCCKRCFAVRGVGPPALESVAVADSLTVPVIVAAAGAVQPAAAVVSW